MKKIFALFSLALTITACVNDDQYDWDSDFADQTSTDTINIDIKYNGTSATVTGDDNGYVSMSGANVIVKSSTNKFLLLTLTGSTDNGSLLIYSWKKLGVILNNVSITNPQGPAINNQCSKSFYVMTASGTTNTLTDGTVYADAPLNDKGDTIDQKATLFSEGQIYFQGEGTLTVNGHAKNGIASDDYVFVQSGTVNVNVAATGSNGVKVNDGFTITGGELNISVAANGARGIKNDSFTTISGGTTTISTSGDCKIENTEGIVDTTSCAGIKSDSLFTMTAGTLSITSTGDGGKGINSSTDFEQQGGKLYVATTGTKALSKPHGIKADGNITFTGGEAYVASARKAFNCDGSLLFNGGTIMGVGKKESIPSDNSTQAFKSYDEDEEIDAIGGQTLTVDGISYTIPTNYSCPSAKVLVSSSNL